jgi:hypothetical protein
MVSGRKINKSYDSNVIITEGCRENTRLRIVVTIQMGAFER